MREFDGTFRAFAETPEYIEVNRLCVEDWVGLIAESGQSVRDVLDLATGTGTMASILLDALARQNRSPTLTCLDRSPEALELAKEALGGEDERTAFLLGDAADPNLPAASMDVVVIGNGIHYLTEAEQETLAGKVKTILRPGGYFLFNTAFFDGTIPEETVSFYRAKTKEAVRFLRGIDITREEGAERAEAANLKPIEHYRALAQRAGMKIARLTQYPVRGSLRFYQGIASYLQYAQGILRGYPVRAAADALVKGTEKAFALHAQTGPNGEQFILRNWLSMSAQA